MYKCTWPSHLMDYCCSSSAFQIQLLPPCVNYLNRREMCHFQVIGSLDELFSVGTLAQVKSNTMPFAIAIATASSSSSSSSVEIVLTIV